MLRVAEATDTQAGLALNAMVPLSSDALEDFVRDGASRTVEAYDEARAVTYGVTGLTAIVMALALTAVTPETMAATEVAATEVIFGPPRLKLIALPHYSAARAEMEAYRELHDGWDGAFSVAPKEDALKSALEFLGALPTTAKAPEPTVSGDGSVGWFWKSPSTYVSVSFPGDRKLVYFGDVKGRNKQARGAYTFDGETLPQDLLDVIALA